MIAMGCNQKTLKAKVFGGGEVIETNIKQFHIGQRNIEIAFQTAGRTKNSNCWIQRWGHPGKTDPV
ncbi:MAG: hypothetical protein MZV70_53105 [Desulfobacterales bacterium]|nr:hypothetical protein [Desulfobacterales bacterium]